MSDSVNVIKQCSDVAPEEFPAPIGKLLGLKLLQAENGKAVVEFIADKRHANPAGTLHGGVLCDIADAAMGFAYYTPLAADESLTTLELKINFLRPVWKATLRAKARVVRAGRFVGFVECDFDSDHALDARVGSSAGRRPSASSPRSVRQVLDARATSRSSSSTTSHSTSPTNLPSRTTLALARSVAFHTGRKKLIFNSSVVKLSSAASVL